MDVCDYCLDGCGNCELRKALDPGAAGGAAAATTLGKPERIQERVRHDGADIEVHEPDMGGEGG